MLPAGKRLHTCQPIVGHGVLRLKHNADLAPMKRKSEIRFKLLLIDCKIAVFAEADLPALAVRRLGIGKRRPCPAKQASRIIAGKRSGYSTACGQADKMVTRAERPRHLIDQAMGNEGRTGSRCVRSQTNQELGARHPSEHNARSEKRRVGNEGCSKCISRWCTNP